MEEIVSNCCSATLLDLESDLCSQCLEHCDPINLEEEDQPTPIPREVIEKILKQMDVN